MKAHGFLRGYMSKDAEGFDLKATLPWNSVPAAVRLRGASQSLRQPTNQVAIARKAVGTPLTPQQLAVARQKNVTQGVPETGKVNQLRQDATTIRKHFNNSPLLR